MPVSKVWPSMLSLFYNEAWNENVFFLKKNYSSAAQASTLYIVPKEVKGRHGLKNAPSLLFDVCIWSTATGALLSGKSLSPCLGVSCQAICWSADSPLPVQCSLSTKTLQRMGFSVPPFLLALTWLSTARQLLNHRWDFCGTIYLWGIVGQHMFLTNFPLFHISLKSFNYKQQKITLANASRKRRYQKSRAEFSE